MREQIRTDVGAIATPKQVRVVSRLPKTRSGKVLRRSIRQIAADQEVVVPATIEDESALDVVRAAFAHQEVES